MKSLLLVALCGASLFVNSANAKLTIPVVNKLPKATLGAKIGANFEQLTGDSWENKYKPGIVFGVFGGVHKNNWGVKAEVLFNTAQYTVSDITNAKFKTVTLNVPVLVEYKIVPRLWVQAGPQFNSILSVKSDNSIYDNPKEFFNTSSINIVGGLEARLPAHFVAGARYILGITDLNNTSLSGSNNAWRTRTIQAYVGFRFI